MSATDVIATVIFGPQRYEIAWPWDPDLERGMCRDPWRGVVRLHGDDLLDLHDVTLDGGYASAGEVVSHGLVELAEILRHQP